MENYPLFNQNYLKLEDKNNCVLCYNFEKYLDWALNYIINIQTKSSNSREIPLSFYPIAKNIRFVSSHLANNIKSNNLRGFLNQSSNCGARNGEDNFWKYNLGRGDWYPWLWSRERIKDNFSNNDAWAFYFNTFKNNPLDSINLSNIVEPPEFCKIFFIYLACLYYTFQLNEQYMEIMNTFKTNMGWPEKGNVLAVQIRRGDCCSKEGKSNREYFNTDKYIEKIELLLNANQGENAYEYIYISTDSKEEIDNIKIKRPDWKILYLPIERDNFPRMIEDAPQGSNGFYIGVDIEDTCRLNPYKIPFIVDSSIADLYFISQSQGYVSTLYMSEFSKCGWYLQMAFQKKLCPYINLNSKKLNQDEILLLL